MAQLSGELTLYYVHFKDESDGLLIVGENRTKAKQYFLSVNNLPQSEFFKIRSNKVCLLHEMSPAKPTVAKWL